MERLSKQINSGWIEKINMKICLRSEHFEEELSLESLQSEDRCGEGGEVSHYLLLFRLRRPSLDMYQLSDRDHPDLSIIQTDIR